MIQSSIRVAAIAMRWASRVAVALVLLAILAWAALHWVIVPRIDQFRPRLETLASRALATSVTIGALRAESNGLVPAVSLHDLRVHDPAGHAGLLVPRTLVAFSVASLLQGGVEQLVIDQPVLEVRRTAQGRLLVGGIDLSGDAAGDTQVADWIFSQEEILVRGGSVRWVDEQRGAPPVGLTQVDVVLRNGLRRHQMRLDATPEAAWGERFTLIGQFRQPLLSRHAGQWRGWDGQVYAELPRFDAAQWRQAVDFQAHWGVDLRGGRGALRLWADVRRGRPAGATADLALGGVAVTLAPGLEPLGFASLQGRLGWRGQDGGMGVSTRDLQFVDADGLAWPGGNVEFSYRDGEGGKPAGGELRGDRLDLAALAKIAQRLPLPAEARERLRAHPLAGLVERLEARWDGALEAPRDWRVQARVSALAIGAQAAPPGPGGKPAAGVPGIEGAALDLDAAPTGGRATLAIRDGALAFPGVFEEPRIPLAALSARAQWRVQGERVELDVDELTLANADATGVFKARWHTGDAGGARFPGVLDLQGAFGRANGARVYRYLPLGVVPQEARDYVRDAIQKGDARDVVVRIRGDLRQVPFNLPGEVGEFRFGGQVSGVTLAYVPRRVQPESEPPWPALEDLSGELVFERASMRVRGAKARVQGHPGWRFAAIQADIADLDRTRVVVEAEGQGPLAAALGIVRQSPAAQLTRHALDDASATGEAGLRLRLDLPIARLAQSKVQGRVALQGNDLRLSAGTPLLAQARGAVTFSDAGFAIQDARVRLLGGEARVSGGTPPADASETAEVLVRASGTATAEGLRQMTDWGPVAAIARQAGGSAAYEAVIGFRGSAPDVVVTSDLRGLAVDLPAPLAKPAEAAWPLRFELRPQPASGGAAKRERLRLTVADVLALDYELDPATAPAHVLRGAVAVGAPAVQAHALPASGVLARVHLPRLEVEPWEEAARRLSGAPQDAAASPPAGIGEGYVPGAWSVRVDELRIDERTLHDVAATGTREGTAWRADVQARELAGRIEYAEGAEGRAGQVRARLARLSIPAGGANESTLAEPPARIPALDVVVEDFELRGKKLGRLEVQAVNRDVAPPRPGADGVQEWHLSRLALAMPEASFSASGRWAAAPRAPALPAGPRAPRAEGDPRRTALDFRLDIRDAGALLARLDMPGVLLRGKGQIDGRLGWAGSPLSPHYPSMDGLLHVDVGAGQFLKAEPGIAKLLGVLSLQALPRRLTLDFRDLFSAGFAFDFVRGDVDVRRGVAHTNNLRMKGVNAAVLMDGSADIDHETQQLRVLVVPEIDAGTAALVATAINPAIGIGAFLAQLVLQRPLVQAATREFHVGGTWDNPRITPVDPRAGRASEAPAAAEAKP
ncbi:YhdP family protein [Ottowia sp.]|uniref:YhdP family protein n=1 Tax=Ottowia sp. TaxID=1898956 RepID=UPI0025E00A47|nr:YhdP family protein [Ottowia sp.]